MKTDIIGRREQMRELLADKTGCEVQHDGWPCNSCFHALDLGISNDRLHELWQSVLAYRGDYSPIDIEQTPDTIKANIAELFEIIDK